MFLHRFLASFGAARRAGVGESTVVAPSKAASFKAGKTVHGAARGRAGTVRALGIDGG